MTNVLHSCVAIASLAIKLEPDLRLGLRDLVVAEVICLLLNLAAFRFITLLVERCARREVEGEIAVCERSALSSLLEVPCCSELPKRPGRYPDVADPPDTSA